ncbi:hypothetical protein JW859_07680 [bacterium]|nr:hypothetical protein [bacterium]
MQNDTPHAGTAGTKPTPTIADEAYKAGFGLDGYESFSLTNRAYEKQNPHYINPRSGWVYRAKPVGVMVVFATLAVLLIVGQFWLSELNDVLGRPVANIGWIRFMTFVTGGYCAFMAWPRYRHKSDTGEVKPPPPRLKTRR